MARTREQWIKDEKRTAGPGCERYSTIKELAAVLGRDETTLKRRLKKGRMPEADAVTAAGWQLWSPKTVKKLVRAEGTQVRG